MDKSVKHEIFKQLCAQHGLKCTPQRFAVYEYIKDNPSHPAVDQIWQAVRAQLPSITRESVFRILNELAEMQVIYRLDRIVNARFDGFAHNHGHLICDQCGAIVDFAFPENLVIPAADAGFHASHMELRISGLCPECAAAAQAKPTSDNNDLR